MTSFTEEEEPAAVWTTEGESTSVESHQASQVLLYVFFFFFQYTYNMFFQSGLSIHSKPACSKPEKALNEKKLLNG